jgi:hypothetical protein
MVIIKKLHIILILSVIKIQNPLKLNAKYKLQKNDLIPKDEPHQV